MATLSEIRDRIKQRTDNEYTDGFITDAEIDGLINLHYKRLYRLLQKNGLHRVETEFAIEADGSTEYALPVDLYAVLGVYWTDESGYRWYLTRHDHRVTPGPQQANAATYRVVGGLRVQFDPTPADGDYTVLYIPIPPDLTADDDTIDGVLGWEEYVVLAACVDVMVKESVDPAMIGHVRGQLGETISEIRAAARDVEMSEGVCVADVRSRADVPSHRNVVPAGLWPYGRY